MKKKRRLLPLKVLTTAALLSSLLFSSAAYGEENSSPGNMDLIVQQGQSLLIKERQERAAQVKEKLGYGDKESEQSKAYKPGEKVRIIVEVAQPEIIRGKTQIEKIRQLKQVQDQVIHSIDQAKSNGKVRHRFFEGVNSFSMDTEYQNIDQIASQPNVVGNHIAKTFKPSLSTSKDLVQARQTWEQLGMKGEGLLVSVVDSGLDYTHKDMVLSTNGKAKEKWTESSIQPKLQETEVNEMWYSDKVPTGYDWADQDDDVIPRGNPHGMHFAGIVGANGDVATGGVTGVAPEAQLLAEKVFSDTSGSAYEDDIIAGIEHAVNMNADVINLSLGTDAGYVSEEDDPIQKAIRHATEKGTLVVAAAGNAYYSSKNNIMPTSQKPYAENPDIGIVGSLGISPFALSVASYENNQIQYETLSLSNGSKLPYADQTYFNFKLHKTLAANTSYDLVYGGEGKDSELKNLDVKDKVVLVKPKQDYSTYSYAQFAAGEKGQKR
jgi:lactocepin